MDVSRDIRKLASSVSRVIQKTVKEAVTLSGVGLHTGKPARVTILPAAADFGIRFVRTDLKERREIPARFDQVMSTQLATTLGCQPSVETARDGATTLSRCTVSTVEHLLAALYGLGIHHVLVEVDGPEVPIMDGSASPFVDAILKAGIKTLGRQQPMIEILRKVEVKVGEKWAVAQPGPRFEVRGSIEFDHPSIGYQEFAFIEGVTSFSELARARTFCMLRDVEALQRMGLARGGSLDNAIVLDTAGVANPDGLRFADEFVRHKVLDALGDFVLAGVPFVGSFRLHRAGHEAHLRLLQAIFSDAANYRIIGTSSGREVERGLSAIFVASAASFGAAVIPELAPARVTA